MSQNDLHHLRNTPWGTVSETTFRPAMNRNVQPLRCPACSNLFEPGFLMQNRCPNCNMHWGLKDKRDMLVEEMGVAANGNWDRTKLESLQDKDAKPSIVTQEGDVREIDHVARNMAQFHLQKMAAERARVERTKRLAYEMTKHSRLNALR